MVIRKNLGLSGILVLPVSKRNSALASNRGSIVDKECVASKSILEVKLPKLSDSQI
jgi:hypothetical protein